MGKNVKGFSIGDRCVADVGITVSPFRCTATQELISFISFLICRLMTPSIHILTV
jgi:hypothetical protein